MFYMAFITPQACFRAVARSGKPLANITLQKQINRNDKIWTMRGTSHTFYYPSQDVNEICSIQINLLLR